MAGKGRRPNETRRTSRNSATTLSLLCCCLLMLPRGLVHSAPLIMNRAKKPRTGTRLASIPAAVTFRLEKSLREALDARAAALGVKPNLLARGSVVDQLQANENRANLHEAMQAAHGHIAELREDLSLAIETLLVACGDVDKQEARAWVEKNFPCYPSPNR